MRRTRPSVRLMRSDEMLDTAVLGTKQKRACDLESGSPTRAASATCCRKREAYFVWNFSTAFEALPVAPR